MAATTTQDRDGRILPATHWASLVVFAILVPAIRAWDDFDTGNVMTYLYLGGLVAGDVALLLLYRSMARQVGSPRR